MTTGTERIARRGFPLKELMVVIALLGVLMGLLVPVFSHSHHPRINPTRALLEGISQGLNRFYTEFGVYPPSNAGDLGQADVEPDSLYKYLCTTDRDMIETKLLGKKPTGKPLEPFIDVPAEYLRTEGNSTIIVDSWGSPIVYLNCKEYTDARVAKGLPDDGKCHNPQNFDLYSFGPDKRKDPDPLNPVDDIVNWSSGPQTGK